MKLSKLYIYINILSFLAIGFIFLPLLYAGEIHEDLNLYLDYWDECYQHPQGHYIGNYYLYLRWSKPQEQFCGWYMIYRNGQAWDSSGETSRRIISGGGGFNNCDDFKNWAQGVLQTYYYNSTYKVAAMRNCMSLDPITDETTVKNKEAYLGENNYSKQAADPVNTATGNLFYEHSDFQILGRGIPVNFIRIYNSQNLLAGPLGYSWTHSYNMKLTDEGNAVLVRYADGFGAYFDNKDGNYISRYSGIYDKLEKLPEQTYILTTKYQTKYYFNSLGNLSKIKDKNAKEINLSYNATGNLFSIMDSVGRTIQFTYDTNNRITQIIYPAGRVVYYAYDSNGDLIGVTDAGGNTIHYYYDNHKLTKLVAPNGNTVFENTYKNYSLPVVISQKDGKENVTTFNYEPPYTTIINPEGDITFHEYDSQGRLIKERDSLGNFITYTYDNNNEIESITDAKGYTTYYTYDSLGNLLLITNPQDNTVFMSYHPTYNLIENLTDTKGEVTQYDYDASNGNLLSIAYPEVDGQIPKIKFSYNLYGQIETVTDANGIITKYEYNYSTADLIKIINDYGGINATTKMIYDNVGNIASLIDANGHTTYYNYDPANQLIKVTLAYPFSYITKYTYDKNGNLIQIDRQKNTEQTQWQTTKYTYTILDQLENIIDPLGNVTTFDYDANGNRNSVTDAKGNKTTYEYDIRNLLWKVTDAQGKTTEYSYDENRNLAQIKDANSNITEYGYDNLNRLIKTIYADSSTETYNYDSNSNLITKTDPQGQAISYAYDALNRLDLKTYPDNSTMDYIYDLGSRLTDVIDADATLNYVYDNLNRITQPQTLYSLLVTRYSLNYEYDLVGNRTRLIYPDGDYITYDYDELNRLTRITDSTGQSIAKYAYDVISRRTELKLANNTKALYSYDNSNRLTALKNKYKTSTISTFDYTYDKVGNRKSLTTQEGKIKYIYDELSQLKKVVNSDSSFKEYSFDPVGNRVKLQTNSSLTKYTTNNLNQYTKINTTNYAYDLNGNLINDSTSTYVYDYENRLQEVTSAQLPVINMIHLTEESRRMWMERLQGIFTMATESLLNTITKVT